MVKPAAGVLIRLRVLNLSKNRLSELPPLNANSDLNRVQELYLMSNCLGDAAVSVIAGYPRLKVLHLAYNEIETLSNRYAPARYTAPPTAAWRMGAHCSGFPIGRLSFCA